MSECTLDNMIEARRSLAQRLRVFDANLWFGPPAGFPNATELAPEEIGETLRACHLTGGLVSHWWGKTISAQDGNRALLAALDECAEDVYAVLTGLPLLSGDDGPLPGHGDLPARVRGVRVFPQAHKFPLTDWCVGGLCEWLIAHHLPLFVWHTETDWPALYALAGAFPALPIIVETQVQKILYHTRPLFALLAARPNVRVELSNFAGQGFVEYVVRQYGAERLLYGSFLPVSDPLVPLGLVLDAEISEDEKALIAGDNLRRLIGEARP